MSKLLFSGVAFIGFAFAMAAWYDPDMREKSVDAMVTGSIVLELFTSQGCSSCPPADGLLRELAADPEWRDKIIPLSFHVDYWNYLGWRDPFSKGMWTERQGDYVQAMGGATMYTPQVVVHGRAEMVGSKSRLVKHAIKEQLKNPEAHQLFIAVDSVSRDNNVFSGNLSVKGRVPASGAGFLLIGVVFEKGLSTDIRMGENAGKTLKNDFVVRNLQVLSRLQETSNLDIRQRFELNLGNDSNSSQFGVAVFAQDSDTMQIIGAAVRL